MCAGPLGWGGVCVGATVCQAELCLFSLGGWGCVRGTGMTRTGLDSLHQRQLNGRLNY